MNFGICDAGLGVLGVEWILIFGVLGVKDRDFWIVISKIL